MRSLRPIGLLLAFAPLLAAPAPCDESTPTLQDFADFSAAWSAAHAPGGGWDGSWDLTDDGVLDHEDAAAFLAALLVGPQEEPYPLLLAEAAGRYCEALVADDRAAALQDFLDWLGRQDEVAFCALSSNGTTVSVETPTGELYVYLLGFQLPVGGSTALPARRVAPAQASLTTLMPELGKAGCFSSLGPGFWGITELVAGYLEDAGFDVAPNQDLTLAVLEDLADYDVLLLTTHGSWAKNLAGNDTFTLATVHRANDPAILSAYAADIAAQLLVKATVVCDITDPHNVLRDSVIAATTGFIQKYNDRLAPNNITVACACESTEKPEIGEAFVAMGSAAFLGWNRSVKTEFAADAVPYFFERLIEKNNTRPTEPLIRPLNVSEALTLMDTVGLREDPFLGAQFTWVGRAYTTAALRPGVLCSCRAGEVLHLDGSFGVEEGRLLMGGTPLAASKWTNSVVEAPCPEGYQAGVVVVEAANGGLSNQAIFGKYEGTVDLSVENSHFGYSGDVVVTTRTRQFAGAYTDLLTLDILRPVARAFNLIQDGGHVRCELEGMKETGKYRYVTAFDEERDTRFGDLLSFTTLGDGITNATVLFSFTVPVQVTDLDTGDSWFRDDLLTLSKSHIGDPLATYDEDTGVIGAGLWDWELTGDNDVIMSWTELAPSPAVDPSAPR